MVRLREGGIDLAAAGLGAKNKSAFPCFCPFCLVGATPINRMLTTSGGSGISDLPNGRVTFLGHFSQALAAVSNSTLNLSPSAQAIVHIECASVSA
jgi:hypothetical protein